VVFPDITYVHHLIPSGYAPRPAKLDATMQEEASINESSKVSQLFSRLASVRDMIQGLLVSDDVPKNSRIYQELQFAENLSKNMTFVRGGGSVLLVSRFWFVIINWTFFLFFLFWICWILLVGWIL
jgi:hypothetical protein